MPIWLTMLIKALEFLSSIAEQASPLITQGEAVLSETDAQKVHVALTNAEAATATLRPQVDAALAAAAKR